MARAQRESGDTSGRWAWLAPAVVLTLLNAACPPTVDDPAYLRQAAWWAAHPGNPLGGWAHLDQALVPAAQVTSAPVAIGWLALLMRLIGSDPAWLALGLLPWAALLAWALAALARRLAADLAPPLVWLVVLSTAVLPSFRFMLDVPALALVLASLAVLTDERDDSPRTALLAGALAGLALQTKLTALPLLAAMLAWGLFAGRAARALQAITTGLAVAVGIEVALFANAGTSPLLEYLRSRPERDPDGHFPLVTAKRLAILAGSAAPAWLALGLAALGASRVVVRGALVAVVAGLAAFAWLPTPAVAWLDTVTGGRIVNFENATLGWMGPVLVALAGLAAWRTRRDDALARAAVAWLAAEAALAPFVSASASVRRLLGALVALALVFARLLAERARREPDRRTEMRLIAAVGGTLALAYGAVGLDSALAERRALARSVALASASGGGRVAVIASHWGGAQDAAEAAALARLAVGDTLARGDWLIQPFDVNLRGATLDDRLVALVDSVPHALRLPVTTRRSYYDGRLALRRVDPQWPGTRLHRMTADGAPLIDRP